MGQHFIAGAIDAYGAGDHILFLLLTKEMQVFQHETSPLPKTVTQPGQRKREWETFSFSLPKYALNINGGKLPMCKGKRPRENFAALYDV